jgi:hypothetical protein
MTHARNGGPGDWFPRRRRPGPDDPRESADEYYATWWRIREPLVRFALGEAITAMAESLEGDCADCTQAAKDADPNGDRPRCPQHTETAAYLKQIAEMAERLELRLNGG